MSSEENVSSLGFSNPGNVDLKINDSPKDEAVKEKQKAQADTLKKAAETGTPFCEKCQVEDEEEDDDDYEE